MFTFTPSFALVSSFSFHSHFNDPPVAFNLHFLSSFLVVATLSPSVLFLALFISVVPHLPHMSLGNLLLESWMMVGIDALP